MFLDSKARNDVPVVKAKTIYEQKQAEILAEKHYTAENQTQIRKFDVNVKLTGLAGTDVQVGAVYQWPGSLDNVSGCKPGDCR